MNIIQLLRTEKERIFQIADKREILDAMIEQIGAIEEDVRDYLIYETFVEWISYDVLKEEDLHYLFTEVLRLELLTASLGEERSQDVFLRSYASLLMATLLAKDQQVSFLTKEEVTPLLQKVGLLLARENDTRGYVDSFGSAHAIAHFADLNMIAIYHPHYNMQDAAKSLQAVTSACWKGNVYRDDEDERLTRVIIALVERGISEEMLIEWVEQTAERLDFYVQRNGYDPLYLTSRTMTMQLFKTLYFSLKMRYLFPNVQNVLYAEVSKRLAV